MSAVMGTLAGIDNMQVVFGNACLAIAHQPRSVTAASGTLVGGNNTHVVLGMACLAMVAMVH